MKYQQESKRLYETYKPNLIDEQKTPMNMFRLGAEAALLQHGSKNFQQPGDATDRNLHNNASGKAYCCKVGCLLDAEYQITGIGHENVSHSCGEHISDLLFEGSNVVEPLAIDNETLKG